MYTPKGKTHQGGYDDDEICKGMERRAWSLLAEERTRGSRKAPGAAGQHREEDGAAKWKSSGNYLPADVVEKLTFAGADFFSAEATAKKREAQTAEFLANYRHEVTEEERSEMRAAFGPGATVVDIISGKRIRL